MELLQANKKLKIRPMLLEDLDQVMKIEPRAFGEHHWSRSNFTQELSNDLACYLVAIELDELGNEKQLRGYAGSWLVLDEMHITTLATDPDFLRKSVAESILVAYIDLAIERGIRGITLEVRLSNIAAQKLYEKHGFQRQGTRKRYYQDNHEDALLLWTENIQEENYQQVFKDNLEKLIQAC